MQHGLARKYSTVKPSLLFLPFFLLITIALILKILGVWNIEGYIMFQEPAFFHINHLMGQYATLMYNLTQMGDALIFLSLISIFIINKPILCEALVSGLLVSLLASTLLKSIFSVPRPAAVFDHNDFIIVGKVLSGHNSLPSGHSMTAFVILTILMYTFLPKKLIHKFFYILIFLLTGLILAFTRVGVGAHYPLDVIFGGIVGYICGLVGIFIAKRYEVGGWIVNKKYYPFFMLVFGVGCFMLYKKIMHENLLIFYIAFVSLFFSLYKIIKAYAK